MVAQYDNYQVPERDRLCTAEQAKLLAEARNESECSNVSAQVDAAVTRLKELRKAAAAQAKPSTPQTPGKAPAKGPVDMGRCKPVPGVDGKGWDCRQVMGAFDQYTKYNVPVSEQVCTREQAAALVAAKNDASCGNVVVQVGNVLKKHGYGAKAR